MSGQITTATIGVVDTLLRWCGRTRVGVAILVVSLAGFVWVTAHDAQALRMTDFEVYAQGSSRLFAGDLYTRLYSDDHLPFTYPPFGALLLLPLALLPLTVGKIIWLGLSIVALWVAVRRVIEWAGLGAYQQAAGGLALSVTGLALWLQPVRSTLLYGQVNLILMAVLVVGLSSARPLVAGLSVGLTAGVKLIPAANVLYLAVAHRYRAVAVAILTFLATVALGAIAGVGQTWHYFTDLVFDPSRAGDLWGTSNQSLRGALARFFGADRVPLWLVVAAIVTALGVWTCRVLVTAGDTLGAVVTFQLTILLVSPLSWDHHWVWVVPLVLWALAASLSTTRPWPALMIAVGWLLVAGSNVMSLRLRTRSDYATAARPLLTATMDSLYPVCGLLTLALLMVIAFSRRSSKVRTPAHR